MKTFLLKIIKPEGQFYNHNVIILNVSRTVGDIGVLKNHIPTILKIKISKVSLVDDKNKRHILAISGGVLYVKKEEVIIVTEAVEFQDKIDLARAENEKLNAENTLKNRKNNTTVMVNANISLLKAINRINVVKGQ